MSFHFRKMARRGRQKGQMRTGVGSGMRVTLLRSH